MIPLSHESIWKIQQTHEWVPYPPLETLEDPPPPELPDGKNPQDNFLFVGHRPFEIPLKYLFWVLDASCSVPVVSGWRSLQNGKGCVIVKIEDVAARETLLRLTGRIVCLANGFWKPLPEGNEQEQRNNCQLLVNDIRRIGYRFPRAPIQFEVPRQFEVPKARASGTYQYNPYPSPYHDSRNTA